MIQNKVHRNILSGYTWPANINHDFITREPEIAIVRFKTISEKYSVEKQNRKRTSYHSFIMSGSETLNQLASLY